MLENLRKLRDETGISQKSLADKIGVSQQSINKYENHNIEPDISTLIRIADYFNTSFDYLIGHTDIKRKIEPMHPYQLNQEEGAMLEKYRILTQKQKDCIRIIIESYNL